jgi:hypothetical protein
LGETAGTTAADGIAGRQGTYVGGATLNQTGALDGDSDGAVTLDGADDGVVVPYSTTLNPSQFSLEAWARPTVGVGWQAVATNWEGPNSNGGFSLWIDDGNNWSAWASSPSGTIWEVTGGHAVLGQWVHLVETYDGTTLRLYVNGVLAGHADGPYTPQSTQPFRIGQGAPGYESPFQGTIDEVAVYGHALSQDRVEAHYVLGRSYKDTVLGSRPVSYWRFGEPSGPSVADVQGAHSGTYVGGPSTGLPGALAGDSDTAVRFNGSGDYVSVPYAASLNPARFTLEAWAYPTGGQGAYRGVVSAWKEITPSEWQGFAIEASDGDVWTGEVGDGTTYIELPGSPVALGTWAHVVLTYDGSSMRLYVDGTEVAGTTTSRYAGAPSPVDLEIGAEYTNGVPGVFFTGLLDDVAVYDHALSADEVKLHYDSGRQ